MDPISLHKNLQILAEKKINNIILEASSHGLSQKRLDYLKIKTVSGAMNYELETSHW